MSYTQTNTQWETGVLTIDQICSADLMARRCLKRSINQSNQITFISESSARRWFSCTFAGRACFCAASQRRRPVVNDHCRRCPSRNVSTRLWNVLRYVAERASGSRPFYTRGAAEPKARDAIVVGDVRAGMSRHDFGMSYGMLQNVRAVAGCSIHVMPLTWRHATRSLSRFWARPAAPSRTTAVSVTVRFVLVHSTYHSDTFELQIVDIVHLDFDFQSQTAEILPFFRKFFKTLENVISRMRL